MKKWFALLLAVLMLCAITGCGDKSKPGEKDTPTTTTTTTQVEQEHLAPLTYVGNEDPGVCYWLVDSTVTDANETVVLRANTDLTDVQFVSLSTDTLTVDEVLDTLPVFEKDTFLCIDTYVNDAVPTRGVVCTDNSGKTYYYAITYSMKGDSSPSISLTKLNIEALSEAKLDEINTFLNDPDNLGFVQRTFDRPEEVQWGEVLTGDVTFGVYENEWSDAERQALADYLEDTPGTANRYPRAKVEELFQKRLGLSPTELDTPISAHYSEEYDAYYLSFLGIEWVPIYVKSGKIENGIYIVDYSFDDHDATRRVTMRATDDGYQFISNVSIED